MLNVKTVEQGRTLLNGSAKDHVFTLIVGPLGSGTAYFASSLAGNPDAWFNLSKAQASPGPSLPYAIDVRAISMKHRVVFGYCDNLQEVVNHLWSLADDFIRSNSSAMKHLLVISLSTFPTVYKTYWYSKLGAVGLSSGEAVARHFIRHARLSDGEIFEIFRAKRTLIFQHINAGLGVDSAKDANALTSKGVTYLEVMHQLLPDSSGVARAGVELAGEIAPPPPEGEKEFLSIDKKPTVVKPGKTLLDKLSRRGGSKSRGGGNEKR